MCQYAVGVAFQANTEAMSLKISKLYQYHAKKHLRQNIPKFIIITHRHLFVLLMHM